jgi:hypothetical protein
MMEEVKYTSKGIDESVAETVTYINEDEAAEPLVKVFVCDCSRQVRNNELYVFPGTKNKIIKHGNLVFIGENKLMCLTCYNKSWKLIRETNSSSNDSETVTHIHEAQIR